MRKPYVVAFVFGCATTPLMKTVLAPTPALAQTAPRKWDQFCTYRTSTSSSFDGVLDAVNPDLKDKGGQGWELASMNTTVTVAFGVNVYYCFKRPAQ